MAVASEVLTNIHFFSFYTPVAFSRLLSYEPSPRRIVSSDGLMPQAFLGPIRPTPTETKPTELSAALSRRSVISVTSGFLLGTLAAPNPGHSRSTANPQFDGEVNFEPSQQARGEKIDINGAFVVGIDIA